VNTGFYYASSKQKTLYLRAKTTGVTLFFRASLLEKLSSATHPLPGHRPRLAAAAKLSRQVLERAKAQQLLRIRRPGRRGDERDFLAEPLGKEGAHRSPQQLQRSGRIHQHDGVEKLGVKVFGGFGERRVSPQKLAVQVARPKTF
jgi:hypothetical protein